MNEARKECTFLWLIENYSYCWHKNEEELVSPKFTTDGFEGTIWTLGLYPRGDRRETKGFISLYLNRCQVDDGPADFSIKCELSILAENGLSAIDSFECSFNKGDGYGPHEFAEMEEILFHRKTDFLPQDTLKLRCKMWKGNGSLREAKEITARTCIGIEEVSYLHIIEKFSTLEANEKRTLGIKSVSKNHCALTSNLYSVEDPSGGWLMLEITPSAKSYVLAKCEISLFDRSGRKIGCCEADNRLDAVRIDILNLPLSLTRQAILEEKKDYLPDDYLTLQCECVFSTGVAYQKIEKTMYGKPFVDFSKTSTALSKRIYNASQKFSACSSAMNDLKSIYSNQLLTDVEIKTKSKSFHAHKAWLCARSSVFRTMLTSDMREKKSGVILVDDLEDDTVQQLLAFLYTDKLEELCWESAAKLYYAADKYQIEKLKVTCASFLVDNVDASSASELLILADRHRDSDLKKAVEDFILEHEEEVFASEEWENFSEMNLKLAHQTMLLKYKRK